MTPETIFQPIAAQLLLTILVGVVLVFRRLTETARKGAATSDVPRTRQDSSGWWSPTAAATSDNFLNQFETPIIFYVAAISLFVIGASSPPSTKRAGGQLGCAARTTG